MSEFDRTPTDPLADFPYLRGEVVAEGHHENRAFAEGVLQEFALDQADPLYQITVDAVARCLDEVDRQFGSNIDNLGTGYRDDPWAPDSLPAFYHNGLRTKVAIADTATYMRWANEQAGDGQRPYDDLQTICGTILTASFDDLVFKGKRGDDENASRLAAIAYLQGAGAPNEVVDAVDIGIDVSVFDEVTGKQRFDPSRGAVAEQTGSLVGDTFGIGTSHGAVNTFMLAMENMWKAGPPINPKPEVSDERVLYDLAVSLNWQGRTIFDFFDLIQSNEAARNKLARFLEGNRKFVVDIHRFSDPRIDGLLAAGKEQNATLQENLGRSIREGRLAVTQAFQCSLVYARTRPGWERQTSVLPREPFTPRDVANIVLTRKGPDELTNPILAQPFFDRYMAELGR